MIRLFFSKFTKYFQVKLNNKIRNSSLFYLILSYLDINLDEKKNPFLDYVSSVLILHIINLLGTINIKFYLLSNYLILKYNIKNKFPRFIKFVTYYENTSLVFLIL